MFNAKTFLRQCLLAVALAGTALGALAGPTNFHVDVNTAGLVDATYLDLFFSKVGDAAPGTVRVSNITGNSVAFDYSEGDVTFNGDGSVTIGNSLAFANFVDYTATFGGTFGFDLAFSTEFLSSMSTDGSTFAISVLDSGFVPFAGATAQFDIFSTGIVSSGGQLVSITAVPEPSDLLMMVTGLGLVGVVRRRKERTAA
jgi:hypothetical protein